MTDQLREKTVYVVVVVSLHEDFGVGIDCVFAFDNYENAKAFASSCPESIEGRRVVDIYSIPISSEAQEYD